LQQLIHSEIHRQHRIIFIAVCVFMLLSDLAEAQTNRASADIFLKQLTTAEHQGMGGSFVGSTTGANALNSNPAGLSLIKRKRFVLHATRFSRTLAVISKPNAAERFEAHSQYNLRASGIELMNYTQPIGQLGLIGFELAFEHDGRFSRVNHLGKATHAFPQNNLAVGIGYGTKLFGGLRIGADAKWLRSKAQITKKDDQIGHGYAYNIGLIQQVGQDFRVGAVVRNLSNGLSFSDHTIPDRLERDILLGFGYQRRMKNVSLRLGLDFNPPFKDGVRTNLGGEIWYRGVIGGRIGYLRHTEKRRGTIYLFEADATEAEERLWKTEGVTLGLGVNLGGLNINAAYSPRIKPVANEGEQIRIEQGESVFSFSIGPGL
jgi:hypothetical protein